MNIVLLGAGEVGRYLAEQLSTQKHNISLIERSEALAEEMSDRMDIHVVAANGASISAQAEANVPEADLFMALSADDNANMVAASVAKSIGPKKTIARVHWKVQREEWLFNYREHFHIDHMFSSERLAAVELAKYVRNPEGLFVEELARGRIELQQVQVDEKSHAAGLSVRELKLPSRVRLASIRRRDVRTVPGGDDRLEAGDVVTIYGAPKKLDEVLPMFREKSEESGEENVVIFGGGEYGMALAQMLEGEGLLMVLGRLEFFAVLVLFMPSLWRRY